MPHPHNIPALLISAPASNQGKTTVTAALAYHHRAQGKRVRVFKTGPDYIDPMILEKASGAPVYQLDLWMGGEAHCRQLLHEAAQEADLILIEGVMGLFDGECSSAHLAELFNIPVLMVIDGSAMAQTFGAVAHGLATYRPTLPIAGVFANRVASENHYQMLAESLPKNIATLGWLKSDKTTTLPSRHLGLTQACEIDDLLTKIQHSANLLQGTTDYLTTVSFEAPQTSSTPQFLKDVRIAIARDAAFSFIYQANLDLLQAMGATLEFFSPLADSELPDADALYLPGGYPELHLEKLANNHTIKTAIRAHHAAGKVILAECGGMLYLAQSLTDLENITSEMVGLLPGQGKMQERLSNIGLHSVTLPEGELRGHTFHYSTFECELIPATYSEGARKSRYGKQEAVYRTDQIIASYTHLYFPSNPQAIASLFNAKNKK